jgi:hypothetical protein
MLAHGQAGLAAANNERIYFFNGHTRLIRRSMILMRVRIGSNRHQVK